MQFKLDFAYINIKKHCIKICTFVRLGMQFKNIVGHQALKQHLISTVRENRVSHAQLFLGPEGSGSLALALAYAQFINCEQPQADDSCGICPSCLKYEKLIHPDLHFSYPFFAKKADETASTYMEDWRKAFLENPYLSLSHWRNQLEAENKQANINIAEAHDIIKKLSLKAFEAEYKVRIKKKHDVSQEIVAVLQKHNMAKYESLNTLELAKDFVRKNFTMAGELK